MASPIENFLTYDFENDPEFSAGLKSILESGEQNIDDIILRAKLFYFSKKTGQSISVDEYLEYKAKAVPERMLTFAEIQELIQTGQTHLIPYNKTIPDQINSAPPSISTSNARQKPWEVTDSKSPT